MPMVHKIVLNVYKIHHKRLSELKRLSAYISERHRDRTVIYYIIIMNIGSVHILFMLLHTSVCRAHIVFPITSTDFVLDI